MAEDKNNSITDNTRSTTVGKISISVEAVEKEADKILDEARVKSNDILLKAREEVNKIANSSFIRTEMEVEKDKIIKAARDDASIKLKESKIESSRIKTAIGDKEDNIVKRLVGMVTGARAK